MDRRSFLKGLGGLFAAFPAVKALSGEMFNEAPKPAPIKPTEKIDTEVQTQFACQASTLVFIESPGFYAATVTGPKVLF